MPQDLNQATPSSYGSAQRTKTPQPESLDGSDAKSSSSGTDKPKQENTSGDKGAQEKASISYTDKPTAPAYPEATRPPPGTGAPAVPPPRKSATATGPHEGGPIS